MTNLMAAVTGQRLRSPGQKYLFRDKASVLWRSMLSPYGLKEYHTVTL